MKTVSESKIIGVGLQKTGTTSIHYALEILGFRNRHCMPEIISDEFGELCPSMEVPLKSLVKISKEKLENYDGFNDFPIPAIEVLEDLMDVYPDAYYIYTKRSKASWINSALMQNRKPYMMEQHAARIKAYPDYDPLHDVLFSRNQLGMAEFVYKIPYSLFTSEFMDSFYEQHEKRVYERLKDNGYKFLEINLAQGDGWAELCSFIETQAPPSWLPFPRGKSRSRPLLTRIQLRILREYGAIKNRRKLNPGA